MNKELRIASVSGGKDSTALYCLMVETYGQDFLPLFADTGNEHPVTVNYVRNLHHMAGGPEVKIVRGDFKVRLKEKRSRIIKKINDTQMGTGEYYKLLAQARRTIHSGNPFLDMMMWKGRAPSTKAQFCTEWVKLAPQLLYLEENHEGENWIMFSGIRQGESLRRLLGYPMPFTTNTYFDCEYILPVLYETSESIFAYLEEKGVPPNPLYALGYGRVGCFPCIHSNKGELARLPDWAWDKLDQWERRLGRTWFPAGLLPKGLPYIPNIPDVRNWCKTTRGGKTFDMFNTIESADTPSCMSTWGACE